MMPEKPAGTKPRVGETWDADGAVRIAGGVTVESRDDGREPKLADRGAWFPRERLVSRSSSVQPACQVEDDQVLEGTCVAR
jgi:hypothetical protein